MTYQDILASKRFIAPTVGMEPTDLNPALFPFQQDLVSWAVRKGRSALFTTTGSGKTAMQLEWARQIGKRTLILAPLAVAKQTVKEGAKFGYDVTYARRQDQASDGITIANYEMLDRFNPSAFQAVVLDESSILKHFEAKTRGRLIEVFASTPYRLCCTATPAPNDITEIANHAEFLGIMRRVDMLAAFFTHDDEGWRLKRHAVEAFYRWLASWSMSFLMPSDLGYSDDGFILPPLDVRPLWTDEPTLDGMRSGGGIQERLRNRRQSITDKAREAAKLVNADDQQWVIWHGLNEEGRALERIIRGGVLVEGSQTLDEKQRAIEGFQEGRHRVLITKSKIAGFGLNLQQCHQMAFIGLSDSWEGYYQAIRRCWRFGQTDPVKVRIVISNAEGRVLENVLRKEKEAEKMTQELIKHARKYETEELAGAKPVAAPTMAVESPSWLGTATGTGDMHDAVLEARYALYRGDCVSVLQGLPSVSIDLSVFSPPFLSLYTYSPDERDVGNSRNDAQFLEHFRYVADELLRVTKEGRLCCVHCADVPAMLVRDGYIGLKDFPGMLVQVLSKAGWIYYSRVTIDKNPQSQAIRTKAKGLNFNQLERDSSWSRPALSDYILIFRKGSEGEIDIEPEVSREDWILWARPVWYAADYMPGQDGKAAAGGAGIRETDTLNVGEGRSPDDERHIAPLQLGTIERCVRLWSNRGDTVLSPFAGIGSEGFVSLQNGRRFVGIELKESYYRTAAKNLERASLNTNGQGTDRSLIPTGSRYRKEGGFQSGRAPLD